jgi:hypothetical protein
VSVGVGNMRGWNGQRLDRPYAVSVLAQRRHEAT